MSSGRSRDEQGKSQPQALHILLYLVVLSFLLSLDILYSYTSHFPNELKGSFLENRYVINFS
jgi:hypothetical protein